MTPRQSLFYVTTLALLLLIAIRIQSCNSQQVVRNWRTTCSDRDNYYATYGSINPGLKVMDSLRAQTKFILSGRIGVSNKFVPLLPGRSRQDSNHIATLKSLIEVIRMKKQYEVLDAVNQDPQLELAQLLLGKVAEESCLWLNESPDINIPDCTNIDLSLLDELYLRMDLYQTLQSTFSDVRQIMNDASTHDIYTCAWMDHRILDNCATDHNTNYDHRNTLNMLCDDSRFCASAQLCTRT